MLAEQISPIENPLGGNGSEAARPHVLVVDDENGPRQALRMLLKEDYEVSVAADVQSALQTLGSHAIDLVITDLRMPRQSGVDLLRQAKEKYPDVQVIILTGYGHLETARKAVEYGAFAYLEKPFDNKTMLRYVQAGLEKNKFERDRRRLEALALEANRFETLGRLVSGMMHDLGTPLSVIGTTVDFILINIRKGDLEERLRTVQGQVQHCNDLVRSTMNFLRHRSHDVGPYNLNEVVETCLDVAQPMLRQQRVKVCRELAEGMPNTVGSLMLVRQAVLNLVSNACHAMDGQTEPQKLTIRTWVEDNCACLAVDDSGPGVPEQVRERIFDTFYTTKRERGTGLGLAVVKHVMARHGGTVSVANHDDRGASFALRFPLSASHR